MKKEKKLLTNKLTLCVLFLMLGITGYAQHPFLSGPELDVYGLPGTKIKLGKQANDEGKTCYQWYGPFTDGEFETRLGSLQEFYLPSILPNQTTYPFKLTVIGEHYYQQKVNVHVIDHATFQVTPIKGCFSGNEAPQIEDFKITTDPPGLEDRVQLVDWYSSFSSPLLYAYDVKFQLIIDDAVWDEQTAIIYYADDSFKATHIYNLDIWISAAQEIMEVVEMLKDAFSHIICLDLELKPIVPWHVGNWVYSVGFDCCDKRKKQARLHVDNISIGAGLTAHAKIKIPFILELGLEGNYSKTFAISNINTDLYYSCVSQIINADVFVNTDMGFEAFLRNVTKPRVLNASVELKYSNSNNKFHLTFENGGFVKITGCIQEHMVLHAEYTLHTFVDGEIIYPLLDYEDCLGKRIKINVE